MCLMHFLILKLGKRVKVIALKAPIKLSTILSLKVKRIMKYLSIIPLSSSKTKF